MTSLTFLDGSALWLGEASLRATVVAALILCTHAVLRNRLPAVWRYRLWFSFIVVLVLPWRIVTPWTFAAPVAETAAASSAHSASVSWAAGSSSGIVVPSGATSPASAGAIAQPAAAFDWRKWIGLAWLAGALATAACGVIAWRREMHRLRRRAAMVSPELRAEIALAAQKAGLRRQPAVLVSAAVAGPSVTGFLRPLLVLPADFQETGSAAERCLILQHELVHARNGDAAANWILWLLQSVHWFNPLIWLAMSRLRADREMARDSEVLCAAGSAERAAYGEALLRAGSRPPVTGFAAAGFAGLTGSGHALRRRLAGLAHHSAVSRTRHAAFTAACALLLSAGIVTAQKPAPKPAATPAPAAPATEDPAVTAMRKKAGTIMIPALRFEGATVGECAAFLRKKSQELDPAADAASRGINIIVRNEKDAKPVTIDLKNVSLLDAARKTAEAADMKLTITASGLAIHTGDWVVAPGAPQPAVALPKGKAAAAAAKWRVDRLVFDDAPPSETAAFLTKKSAEADPARKGVTISVDPALEQQKITLDMRNATVWSAAEAIAAACGGKLEANDERLAIVPATALESSGKDVKALAQSVKFESVRLDGVSLKMALKFAAGKAGQSSPMAAAIKLELAPGVKGDARVVTLDLRDTNYWDVLVTLAELTSSTLETGEDVIRLVPKK